MILRKKILICFISVAIAISSICIFYLLLVEDAKVSIRIVFYHQKSTSTINNGLRIISSDTEVIMKIRSLISSAPSADVPFRGPVRGNLFFYNSMPVHQRCYVWFYNDVFAEYVGDEVRQCIQSSELADYINAIMPGNNTTVVVLR